MRTNYKGTVHACYLGYITQAIVNNLAPILFIVFQNSFGITFEMIGRLILINFGTQLVVDLLSVRYVDRIGYRPCIVSAHLLCAAGLVLMSILPRVMASPYTGLVIAVMVYAVGGGLIEVLVSPIVDALPGDAKESSMSLLHAFYCWGQVLVVAVSTLLLQFWGSGSWYWLPVLWAAVPLFTMFRFLRVPILPPVSGEERTPLRGLFKMRAFVVALLLMLCAGASELAMSQWSSLFAQKGLQVPKVMGDLLGPCFFAVLMGVGRTVYGIWGQKLRIRNALMLCAGLCVICYVVTALSPIPIVSLLSCALCGLSVSLMWPGTFSFAAAKCPGGGTAMFSLMALFGDMGCSLGPWLAGVISDFVENSGAIVAAGLTPDQIGLKAGILAAVVFPVLMLLAIPLMGKKKE